MVKHWAQVLGLLIKINEASAINIKAGYVHSPVLLTNMERDRKFSEHALGLLGRYWGLETFRLCTTLHPILLPWYFDTRLGCVVFVQWAGQFKIGTFHTDHRPRRAGSRRLTGRDTSLLWDFLVIKIPRENTPAGSQLMWASLYRVDKFFKRERERKHCGSTMTAGLLSTWLLVGF